MLASLLETTSRVGNRVYSAAPSVRAGTASKQPGGCLSKHSSRKGLKVHFRDDGKLVKVETFHVHASMRRTPLPKHDLDYRHPEELRSITPEVAANMARERAIHLNSYCRELRHAVAAAMQQFGPKYWLQDTGSRFDLVGEGDITPGAVRKSLKEPIHLMLSLIHI